MCATQAPVKVALANGINNAARRAVKQFHFPQLLNADLLQHLSSLPEVPEENTLVYTTSLPKVPAVKQSPLHKSRL